MYLFFKRVFDIVVSLVGLLALIPMAALIKIVYFCTSDKGGILYKQARVGKNGKILYIYKFRSMVDNADELLNELLKDASIKAEWDRCQKLENDPRITKFGSIMREYSIDEMPQFINVFLGEMSLVGPRPLVEGELEAHGGKPLYWKVKPGMTGWWATHGRSEIDYEERLKLEYYYIQNLSFKLDLICILRTIKTVFLRKGV